MPPAAWPCDTIEAIAAERMLPHIRTGQLVENSRQKAQMKGTADGILVIMSAVLLTTPTPTWFPNQIRDRIYDPSSPSLTNRKIMRTTFVGAQGMEISSWSIRHAFQRIVSFEVIAALIGFYLFFYLASKAYRIFIYPYHVSPLRNLPGPKVSS